MKTRVRKWGNSAAVRIPAALMEAARLQADDPVELREEEGRIIIESARKKAYGLHDLVKGITAKNLHDPVELGRPEGKEVG